jgi:hypothetical protein
VAPTPTGMPSSMPGKPPTVRARHWSAPTGRTPHAFATAPTAAVHPQSWSG